MVEPPDGRSLGPQISMWQVACWNIRLHCAVKNTPLFFLVRLSNRDLGAVCYSSEATLTCAGSWRCEKQKVNLETTSSLNSGIPWD